MKFTLVCLSMLVALTSTAPQYPSLPSDNITPIVAERSRCLQNFRRQAYQTPDGVSYKVANKNQFPFMVALIVENVILCGGSLISPTKILTAAQCVFDAETNEPTDAKLFSVKLGMRFFNSTTNDAQLSRNVVKIKIHEGFALNENEFSNNVAVLTLDSPVEYTETISPVCLVPDCINDDDNQSVTSMGWGDKEVDGKKSDFLRFTELSTVSSAKCGKQSDNPVLVENWLCSSKEGPVTCRHDTGGPLVIETGLEKSCRFMQVGIVNLGLGCEESAPIGINTRVKSFVPWILENSK